MKIKKKNPKASFWSDVTDGKSQTLQFEKFICSPQFSLEGLIKSELLLFPDALFKSEQWKAIASSASFSITASIFLLTPLLLLFLSHRLNSQPTWWLLPSLKISLPFPLFTLSSTSTRQCCLLLSPALHLLVRLHPSLSSSFRSSDSDDLLAVSHLHPDSSSMYLLLAAALLLPLFTSLSVTPHPTSAG